MNEIQKRISEMNEIQTEIDDSVSRNTAWEAYQETEDYANAKKWAMERTSTGAHNYVDSSLWVAFCRGWKAAKKTVEETE